MGVSEQQVRDIPAVLRAHVGETEACRAERMLAQYLGEQAQPAVNTVDFNVWPKGEPNTAYAQYFIGNSYLAIMEGGIANVTFEPRCRNNWHVHHKQVQVLVVSGVGQGACADDSRHHYRSSRRGQALARCRLRQLVPAFDLSQRRERGCVERVA